MSLANENRENRMEEENNQNTNREGDSENTKNTSTNNADTDTADGEEEQEESEKSFTQQQVNKMMAREKRQGRNGAFRELGIDPKDKNAIALVQRILKNIANNQDEDGEQQERGNHHNAAEEAEHRVMVAEAKLYAVNLGASKDYLDDIIVLAFSMANNEDIEVDEAIEKVKEKYPVMFGKSTESTDETNKSKKGTGSSVGSRGTVSKNSEKGSLGSRLAAKKKSFNSSKKSFWD